MSRGVAGTSRGTSSSKLEGMKLCLPRRGSDGPSSWWRPAAASLLVLPLVLTGCGRAPASATSPEGETHAEVFASPTETSTGASATAAASQPEASSQSEPSPSTGSAPVKLVAIDQDITRTDNYAFELRIAVAFRHAVEDVSVAQPGQTSGLMPGVDISGTIINKTPRRNLPLEAIDLTVQLVYAANSPICKDLPWVQRHFNNGTCGVTAGLMGFESSTVPANGQTGAAAKRYFDLVGGLDATGIRVWMPDDGKFETYATALDHPIGMVATTNDDSQFFNLPVLCTVSNGPSGTSDAIVAQSSGNPACS